MATYAELFTDYLEEQMEQGGSPETMTAVVEAYNECTQDNYQPDILFREWLTAGTFHCTTCSRGFPVKSLQEMPSPQDEVTCDRCKASSAEEDGDASTPA